MRALAPAKVNLFLHVGPPEANGYHPLCSLVAFADVGDQVEAEPAEALSLTMSGPFAGALADEATDDNLVLRALRAIGAPPLRLTLDKRLPVAAGLGGGSADAGAALRLAREALSLPLSDADLIAAARTVGADGPMCLFAAPAWAEGHGERLTPEPRLPPLPAVLVNPGVPSPTGAVYQAYDESPTGSIERPSEPDDWSVGGVIGWLRQQRNDLEAPAVRLQPLIGDALAALDVAPGVALARMSGSGATVFGLCPSPEQAATAAAAIRARHPGWWVEATQLGAPLDRRTELLDASAD